ncbi:MAG: PfaB family protein [Chloroflexi bacterium]|nr:PfaB family protein [Chloroflexota bacterium]
MEKIAIIGLSCLFPEAETPEQYWQNLVEKKDSTSLATIEEMGVDPDVFYDPVKGRTDKSYCMRGGYIRDFKFDPSGYNIPPEFLDSLDNVFKWPLYVAKQALQDSGYLENKAVLSKSGVILGNLSFPTKLSHRLILPIYQQTIKPALQELLQQEHFALASLPGLGEMSTFNVMTSDLPATVIARALSLSGISFSLDAACATSLYAIKLACDRLLSRQVDLMLAGAVSCADPFFISMGFSIFRAYPQDAISRPFDKLGGGLISGEGAGMLALKRYDDAIRDGDKIYATIRGIGLSNDGKGQFLLTPNPKGQILAFERAYADADIDPKSIDYVECHATGTPLGDKTELATMDTFFGQYNATPLVGAVKSNFGHLLTAAGMTGMIKVILSMSNELIPATINLTDPRHSPNNVIAAEHIVSSATPWPKHTSTKRAAVSAFGFGGTNAHLILEQESGHQASSTQYLPPQPGKMAIVGMDAFFGSCTDLDSFERSIYDGKQHFIPLPSTRWKGIDDQAQLLRDYGFDDGQPPLGAYIKDFEMDFLHFKIPPNDADKPIPQQLLILKIADNALNDAGLDEGANVAVIIAMGTELALHQFRGRCDLSWQIKQALAQSNIPLDPATTSELETIAKNSIHDPAQVNQYTSFIGNIMASRISAFWDFSGPSFTVSAEENSVFKALSVAQLLLTAQDVDAVVVGAVDLAGGVENVLLRNQLSPVNTGTNTMSYDQHANGWMVGEGAGAVVLKRPDVARQNDDRVYAVIDAISLVQRDISPRQTDSFPQPPSATTVSRACQQAFDRVNAGPDDIGYLEVFASGIGQEDQVEIKGLTQAYKTCDLENPNRHRPGLNCAIGSAKANIGHTFAASGMASLIRTALCLYHRYIPATPGWSGPKTPDLWQNSPFYVATESKPWFVKPDTPKRIAAINGLGINGTCAHLILSEEPEQAADTTNTHLAQTPFYLFPIAADDRTAVLKKLGDLEQEIKNTPSLLALANQRFVAFQDQPDAAFALAIVGHDKTELSQEIEFATKGVTDAFDTNGEWKSPLGSYFSANPLGKQGQVAFVYPGAFNSYIDLGRDILHLFPQLHDRFDHITSNAGRSVAERTLYPRSLSKLSEEDLREHKAQLMENITAIIESGTSFAVLFTTIMQDYFQVQPQAAFGYSLGEASMMWALGVWNDGDGGSDAWHASSLFKTRLSGPKEAVRELWKLDPDQDQDFWSTFVLRAPVTQVIECLQNKPRVYLTFINTPKEVVIAGDTKECLQVIETLKCTHLRAPFNSVIHCEAMRSEYDEFAKLHTLPVENVPGIDFYSATNYATLALDSETIAHAIANVSCTQVDFPRLVNRVYDDGARIFIELGPLGTCSRWIDKILGHNKEQKEYVTMSINQKGKDDRSSILRVLAKLLSHRVPLDLSPLYSQAQEASKERALVKTVTLGGERIRATILTEENKQRFRQAQVMPSQPLLADAKPHQPEIILPQPPVSQSSKSGLEQFEQSDRIGANLHLSIKTPDLYNLYQKLNQHLVRVAESHATFLQSRREALRQTGELIQLQITTARQMLSRNSPISRDLEKPNRPLAPIVQESKIKAQNPRTRNPNVVWDEADLLEFAEGRIAPVFGEEYAIIDTYHRRVRLPTPPYLLVSRVTKIKGERGVFEPATITTEYDIPHDTWYTVDGQIPWAVSVESGQCDLLLISYLGIDFENKGDRVYRLLDCTLTFLDDLPHEGQTLRYDISIDSFAKSGESLLFFFSYECFVGDHMVLKMHGGCAGFFTNKELAGGKGIITTAKEIEEKNRIQPSHFAPPLTCPKSTFDKADLLRLSEGDIATCFGAHYSQNGQNPSLRLPPQAIQMIDRVVSVDPQGGAWGLGLITAEKDLEPEHWYFPCHFKDDQVLAGSLVAEGCGQLLQFYLLYLGLQTHTQDARFQPIHGLPQVVRTRKQITAVSSKLIYRMEITEIGLDPKPFAKANVDIIFEGTLVVDFKDLGLQLSEKNPSTSTTRNSKLETRNSPPLFDETHITEFATGSISKCFGPEYDIYEGRRIPRTPNDDLQLISRILRVNGERGKLEEYSSLVSEYDVPADPWFYRHNAYPTLPYSISMEIALQPCGFLSAYLGSTLAYPDEDFYFRNLDGHGRILKDIDVRGKTITNRVRLLSSTSIQGVIIQKFDFQLACEGDPFYQGEAVFGYFTPQALVNQVGLDSGQEIAPWYKQEQPADLTTMNLSVPAIRQRYYRTIPDKPHYRLAHGQLDFLDEFLIVEKGGRYEQGYIYANALVNPQDWFFSCHFYQDPVMPGSLGVEAIWQAIQIYALDQDLGKHLNSPRFEQALDHQITWKYRGQIVPDNEKMQLEIHISEIITTDEQVTIAGDASLWKENMRIYEVEQATIRLLET